MSKSNTLIQSAFASLLAVGLAASATQVLAAKGDTEKCAGIVKAGKTKGNDLAVTYYNRAISYRQKNDTDAALADYNDSIRINLGKSEGAFGNWMWCRRSNCESDSEYSN